MASSSSTNIDGPPGVSIAQPATMYPKVAATHTTTSSVTPAITLRIGADSTVGSTPR